MEVGTTSENADSAVSLKKRHYGRHRSSLLYGGFVDSTVSYSGGAETKASTQEAEDDKEEIEVKLKRYHNYMYGSCLCSKCSQRLSGCPGNILILVHGCLKASCI